MSIKRFLFYDRGTDQIIGFHETRKTYEFAKNVVVAIVRGITSKWKQPIAYCFVNSCSTIELKEIIFESIKKLTDIGLDVQALVSDQG